MAGSRQEEATGLGPAVHEAEEYADGLVRELINDTNQLVRLKQSGSSEESGGSEEGAGVVDTIEALAGHDSPIDTTRGSLAPALTAETEEEGEEEEDAEENKENVGETSVQRKESKSSGTSWEEIHSGNKSPGASSGQQQQEELKEQSQEDDSKPVDSGHRPSRAAAQPPVWFEEDSLNVSTKHDGKYCQAQCF